jgi:hypothetical protein
LDIVFDALAEAQRERDKLRSALKNLCHYIDVMPDAPERLSDEVNFAHMAAQDALAAPPSTAATPPTVPAGRYIFRKKFDEGEDCERAFSVTLREAIAAITTAATPEGKP